MTTKTLTKKKKNPKYKAPYKSTNYLESGDNSNNPQLPQYYYGSTMNQEGGYDNLDPTYQDSFSGISGPSTNTNLNPTYQDSFSGISGPSNSSKGNFMSNFQQKGAYGAIGKASSAMYANQAAQAAKNNDESGQIYNTGMGVVSQAGPWGAVIGTAAGIGEKIGQPIMNRTMTTDEQGNIKNESQFRMANAAQGLFDPFKSISDTFASKNATTGEKIANVITPGISGILFGNRRKKDVEDAAKLQIANTKRLNAENLANQQSQKNAEEMSLKGINRVNNMEMDSRYVNPSNQSFAEGGDVYPGQGSNNNKDITRYTGERHEQGGVTLGNIAEVEGGETRGIEGTPTQDYIFSDRLKTLDDKTTFAMRSKNISNKYKLRPWDPISNNAKDRELQDLMGEHEVVKKAHDLNEALDTYHKAMGGKLSPEDRVQNEMAINEGVFGNGGKIHINPANKGKFNALKARTGKSTEELTHSSNPITKKRAIFAQNAAKWQHALGGNLDNTRIYEGGGTVESTSKPKLLTPTNDAYKNDPIVKEINDFGDINDPRMYDDPDKASRYISVLLRAGNPEGKENEGKISDLSKAYLNNWNRKWAKEKGSYYDPDKPSLHNVLMDEEPERYKELQQYYAPKPIVAPGINNQGGSRSLGDSASYGVRAYGGGLPKYAFGDDIANNSEYINAGTQGAIQLMRSNKINSLQPNKLDYIPISYLNESKYASPLSNVAFRPTRNDEEIQGLNTAYKGAEQASSNYSDSGDYLNRMNAIGAAKSANVGKAWEDHYNQEAQRQMQVDEFNKGIQGQNINRLTEVGMKNRDIEGQNIHNRMTTQEYGNAEKDALNNLKLQNYGDWSNYLTGATEGFAKRSMYNDAMTMQQSKYPLYTFYRDENGRLKSKPRYPNNPELYKTNLTPKE